MLKTETPSSMYRAELMSNVFPRLDVSWERKQPFCFWGFLHTVWKVSVGKFFSSDSKAACIMKRNRMGVILPPVILPPC